MLLPELKKKLLPTAALLIWGRGYRFPNLLNRLLATVPIVNPAPGRLLLAIGTAGLEPGTNSWPAGLLQIPAPLKVPPKSVQSCPKSPARIREVINSAPVGPAFTSRRPW